MGKANPISEVQVLRFFEDGPIEKAEVVFNIVAEKMRERLGAGRDAARASAEKAGTTPKGRAKTAGASAEQAGTRETTPA